MSKVSVVMPVYNAEAFLERSVQSILDQTFEDFELICVDDGSTDGSSAILDRYARKDSRIRVIHQENGGEGSARVAGFEAARGTWLYSIDADDYADPVLIERLLMAADSERAEISICAVGMQDHTTGEVVTCERAFNPSHEVGLSIAPAEYGPTFFDDFECWAWNKLIRLDFLREHGLCFQNQRRIADLYLVYSAMASASRIALVPDELYRYRVGLPTSAFNTMDTAPLDFYKALCAWQDYLKREGLYDTFCHSFITRSMHEVYINCTVAKNPRSFRLILETLKNEGFSRFEFASLPREEAYSLDEFDLCAFFMDHEFEECVFYLLAVERAAVAGYKTYSSNLRLGQADLLRQVDALWKENGKLWETIHRLEERSAEFEGRYAELAYSRKNLLKQIGLITKESVGKKK